MGAIDIGVTPVDGAAYLALGNTLIERTNPANESGKITSFEVYLALQGTSVKMGTFSGSGTSWSCRAYASLGTVSSGSKQTFSGLDVAVEQNDAIGIYGSGGRVEMVATGSIKPLYKAGDQTDGGSDTYSEWASNNQLSIYGLGATTGWANIIKINGGDAADIAEINGVAVADIAKIDGVAV